MQLIETQTLNNNNIMKNFTFKFIIIPVISFIFSAQPICHSFGQSSMVKFGPVAGFNFQKFEFNAIGQSRSVQTPIAYQAGIQAKFLIVQIAAVYQHKDFNTALNSFGNINVKEREIQIVPVASITRDLKENWKWFAKYGNNTAFALKKSINSQNFAPIKPKSFDERISSDAILGLGLQNKVVHGSLVIELISGFEVLQPKSTSANNAGLTVDRSRFNITILLGYFFD